MCRPSLRRVESGRVPRRPNQPRRPRHARCSETTGAPTITSAAATRPIARMKSPTHPRLPRKATTEEKDVQPRQPQADHPKTQPQRPAATPKPVRCTALPLVESKSPDTLLKRGLILACIGAIGAVAIGGIFAYFSGDLPTVEAYCWYEPDSHSVHDLKGRIWAKL